MGSHYTAIPYTFSLDYCGGFFNFPRATTQEQSSVYVDFVGNLSHLLERLHVGPSAVPIAEALFKRMSDPQLYYHTPVHVLAMLQFAVENQIALAWWEEIAIWFHDAVYVPRNKEFGVNEWASAKFMEAMMGPFIANHKLTLISMGIHYTAHHTDLEVPSKFNLLLDLDCAVFAFRDPGRAVANYCVKMEYEPICKDDEELMWGRINFLERLMAKGSLYRSRPFVPHEAKGRHYVLNLMDSLWEDLRIVRGEKPIGP